MAAGSVQQVSRSAARFGYGGGGEIFEISDALPDHYWQHPHHAWSPLLPTRIPGLEGVFIKYESGRLSGSFKDRIMAVTLGELSQTAPSCPGVVVPSSGNAAVAAAAHCVRIGLPMIAVVPESTPTERILPILARGCFVIRGGEGPAAAYALSDEIVAELDYFPLHSTFSSPWAEWGCRSLGLEICGQLGAAPGMVVAPVSAGPVLVGTANGIREAGYSAPPMAAVQSAGCAPIARAFERSERMVEPWAGNVETKATAIADRLTGYSQDGTRTLALLHSSRGFAGTVTDLELAEARSDLFRYDGIDAEFSACAGVAWLRKSMRTLPPNTVCIVTASGFKHTFSGDAPQPDPMAQNGETLARLEDFLKKQGGNATLVRRA